MLQLGLFTWRSEGHLLSRCFNTIRLKLLLPSNPPPAGFQKTQHLYFTVEDRWQSKSSPKKWIKRAAAREGALNRRGGGGDNRAQVRQLEVRENKPEAATQIMANKPKPDYKISSSMNWAADPARNIIAAHLHVRQRMNDGVKTFQLPSFCWIKWKQRSGCHTGPTTAGIWQHNQRAWPVFSSCQRRHKNKMC